MRPSKKRYRFELLEDGQKPRKEYFYGLDDGNAVSALISVLANIPKGSEVVLSRWDKQSSDWVFIRRGGRDDSVLV